VTKFLILLFTLMSTFAYANTNFVPPKAFEFKETIRMELDRHFPNIPEYNFVPALIEHESCITLRHRRCWTPQARLKSAREEGAGLGQITRAFRPDGSIRFDSLAAMRNKHREALREASWDTIYQRPDIQIRMIVLMLRDNFNALRAVEDPMNRLIMTNAAYNGGLNGVIRERRACGLAANCNPDIWFGHVERHCLKSRTPIYGTRSACQINRHHSTSVFNIRLPKYMKYFFTD